MVTRLVIIAVCVLCGCSQTLSDGSDRDDLKIRNLIIVPSPTSALAAFECSAEVPAFFGWSGPGASGLQRSVAATKQHFFQATELATGTTYAFAAVCGDELPGAGIFLQFSTTGSPVPEHVRNRAVWLFGGVGEGARIVPEIDVFDPDTGIWYAAVSSIPTARMLAGVVVHGGRVYVMGGMDAQFNTQSTVEEFDPVANTWRTMASMPQRLQGFIAGSVGSSIYVVGGSTTANMATGTLLNTVYRFTPNESGGSWTTILSNNAIAANVDMAGCAIDGTLFFNTGRFYNDGTAQFTSDAYVPASNTTTTLAEASLTQARHGAAGACYRPQPTDPFPDDPKALLVLGGSVLTNTGQPATAITTSAIYDYYRTGPDGGGPNTVTAGTALPTALYMPAAEISYTRRRLYVFGGASALNVPTGGVFHLDLSSPTGSGWTAASTMPRSRFGHRAVVISR